VRPNALRVTFDLSALHGPNLDALRQSPILRMCGRGQLAVALTPIFLDELIAGYGAKGQLVPWRSNLEFALEVCNDGIFLDKREIWRDELLCGRGPFARHKFPLSPTRRLISFGNVLRQLREMLESGDLQEYWASSQATRDENRARQRRARDISVQLRDQVSQRLRQVRLSGVLAHSPYHEFRDSVLVRTGRELMDLVDVRRSDVLKDQWAQNPRRFPFYYSFVVGFTYAGYYAAARHNEPIDLNAQADYEQLCYLNWLDVVVSNDQTFFRSAFNELWRWRKKRLMTTQEFLEFMNLLAV